MSPADPMWKTVLRRGVEALDWTVVESIDGPTLQANVVRRNLDPQVRLAAYAAIEIDKLVRWNDHGASADLDPAVAPRRAMVEALIHDALDCDAALAAKAAYRSALAAAGWEMVQETPVRILRELAKPHEE